MKKVWILEKFISREECEKMIEEFSNILNTADNKIIAEDYEKVLHNLNKKIEDNPDGYWSGFEGKSNYKDFCFTARQAIRRQPTFKFRVIEAEIPDDANYWIGYNINKVNDGVYRYLMATK